MEHMGGKWGKGLFNSEEQGNIYPKRIISGYQREQLPFEGHVSYLAEIFRSFIQEEK